MKAKGMEDSSRTMRTLRTKGEESEPYTFIREGQDKEGEGDARGIDE
jgi:hypothetical protein